MSEYGTVQISFRWSNFYKAKEALTKMGNGTYVRGAFKIYSEDLLKGATAYAAKITHVYTGHLSKSHTWDYDSHAMKGRLYVNPRVAHANWMSVDGLKSGSTVRWPFLYAVYEHARGAPHNFYERTMNEYVKPRAIPGLSVFEEELNILWR